MSDTAGAILREVVEFHRAVEGWFGAAPDEAHLARMAVALAPAFLRVGPEGDLAGRDATLARLRAARGLHAAADPPFAVAIEEFALRWTEGPRALAAYVERQAWGGRTTRRRALAAFRLDGPAGGVLWTDLAETWLPAVPSGPSCGPV